MGEGASWKTRESSVQYFLEIVEGQRASLSVVIRDFMRIYGHSRMKDEIRAILVRSREDIGLAEEVETGCRYLELLNVKASRLFRVSRRNGS